MIIDTAHFVFICMWDTTRRVAHARVGMTPTILVALVLVGFITVSATASGLMYVRIKKTLAEKSRG